MAGHSQETGASGAQRVGVFAGVCVCHALLIWAFAHGRVIRVLSDATGAIEVRIIQKPPRPFERLSLPGPHLRDLARSSIQLKAPSFNVPIPPSTAAQPDAPPVNGDANGVNADIGAGASTGDGGHLHPQLTVV
jgi:hypothetical protein